MRQRSRTLAMLAAGVVLLMAATLAADVVLSNSAIRVIGPPTSSTGEVLRSEMTGFYPSGAAIRGFAPSTGIAVYGSSSSGVGVLGTSTSNAGVRGSSASGWGGHFTSSGGYGVYAYTTGTAFWDHGVYASANWGYGVYGKSTNNDGVRGEGESAGVRGFGTQRGVYGYSYGGNGVGGSSYSGYGVTGSSNTNYGGSFSSWDYRGMYVLGDSGYFDAYFQGNTGIFVEHDIRTNGDIIASGSKAGYVVDLARNDGRDPLHLGDVVVITGATDPMFGQIPVPTVRLVDEEAATGVMGVVDRMFATPADFKSMPRQLREEWLDLARRSMPTARTADAIAVTGGEFAEPESDQISRITDLESHGRFLSQFETDFIAKAMDRDPGIAPGAYLGVVTLGAFKAVRVDASYGSILPGDLLVSSPTPGHAMRAPDPQPGTIIGKALGSLEEGQGTVPVLITAQ